MAQSNTDENKTIFETIDSTQTTIKNHDLNKMTSFPNPFTKYTIISFDKKASGELVLYDLLGNKMWSYALITQKKIILYKNDLPKGIYLLQFYEVSKTPQVIRLVID